MRKSGQRENIPQDQQNSDSSAGSLTDWFRGHRQLWVDIFLEKLESASNALEKFCGFRGWRAWLVGLLSECLTLVLLALLVLDALSHIAGERLSAGAPLQSGIAVEFLDRHGQPLGQRGVDPQKTYQVDALPKEVAGAFLAVEDPQFWTSSGANYQGLALLFRRYLKGEGSAYQCGDKILLQLARALYPQASPSLHNQITEHFLALSLSGKHDKSALFKQFLDTAYFGEGLVGVETAALAYFSKAPTELSAPEAISLAALKRSAACRGDVKSHYRQIIDRMEETPLISAEIAAQYRQEPPAPAQISDNAFADFALDQAYRELLSKIEGQTEKNFVVQTSLDAEVGRLAAEKVEEALKTGEGALRLDQGIALVMSQKGEVLAFFGGLDYARSRFGRTIEASRGPGTLTQPLIYAAALENGYSLSSILHDGDGPSASPVVLRDALQQASTTLAARLASAIGEPKVDALAERFGLGQGWREKASLFQLTEIFRLFLSGAKGREASFLMTARNAAGESIALHAPPPLPLAETLDPTIAEAIVSTLKGLVAKGAGARARIDGVEALGMPGSRANFHDAWFFAEAEEHLVLVWLGRDDNAPMGEVRGEDLPAQIAGSILRGALLQKQSQ